MVESKPFQDLMKGFGLWYIKNINLDITQIVYFLLPKYNVIVASTESPHTCPKNALETRILEILLHFSTVSK